jgi:hypothetical protein
VAEEGQILQPRQRLLQDDSIQKHQRAERLALRRRPKTLRSVASALSSVLVL